jgi:hypothetical protein
MSRVRSAALLLGALALAGCTSQAADTPAASTSPPPATTVAPTPEATPASTVADLSDPELGILFEDVPALTGDEADVYRTVATFQVEYWRTMTTNTVSPGAGVVAAPEMVAVLERIATNNGADSAQIGGTFRTRVSDVEVDGDVATALTCDMYADVTFADVNGSATPEEAGFGDNILLKDTLRRTPEGRWVLGTSERTGTC